MWNSSHILKNIYTDTRLLLSNVKVMIIQFSHQFKHLPNFFISKFNLNFNKKNHYTRIRVFFGRRVIGKGLLIYDYSAEA